MQALFADVDVSLFRDDVAPEHIEHHPLGDGRLEPGYYAHLERKLCWIMTGVTTRSSMSSSQSSEKFCIRRSKMAILRSVMSRSSLGTSPPWTASALRLAKVKSTGLSG